jgi:hypothetical protein
MPFPDSSYSITTRSMDYRLSGNYRAKLPHTNNGGYAGCSGAITLDGDSVKPTMLPM